MKYNDTPKWLEELKKIRPDLAAEAERDLNILIGGLVVYAKVTNWNRLYNGGGDNGPFLAFWAPTRNNYGNSVAIDTLAAFRAHQSH